MLDAALIKSRLPLPEHLERITGCIWARRTDREAWAICPFHANNNPDSFHVVLGKNGWFGKCFACEAKGDLIALHQLHTGQDFKTALTELATLAGLSPDEQRNTPRAPRPKPVPPIVQQRPTEMRPLPPAKKISEAALAAIAHQRHLRIEGPAAAMAENLLGGNILAINHRGTLVWGEELEEDGNRHGLRCGPHPSWILTDPSQHVAQARRMDGQPWVRHDGGTYKANTIVASPGTGGWPLGTAQIGNRKVCLVEGGPDLLAAHDLLHRIHGPNFIQEYCVVCTFGAAIHIREDALRHFSGTRVRIYPHADPIRVRTRKDGTPILDKDTGEPSETCPGLDGALKWQDTLTTAGATIDIAFLHHIPQLPSYKDPTTPGTDLNDLAAWDHWPHYAEIFQF